MMSSRGRTCLAMLVAGMLTGPAFAQPGPAGPPGAAGYGGMAAPGAAPYGAYAPGMDGAGMAMPYTGPTDGSVMGAPTGPEPSKALITGNAGTIFLDRDRSRTVVTSVDDFNTFNNTADDVALMSTDELRFDTEAGIIANLKVQFLEQWAAEMIWFGMDEWEQVAAVDELGQLSSPQAISLPNDPDLFPDLQTFDDFADDFYQSLHHDVRYESNLNNVEVNIQPEMWTGMTETAFIQQNFLFGVRYVRVDEHFALNTRDEPNSTPANGFGVYSVQTENNLWGGQIGTQMCVDFLNLWHPVRFTGFIKAGLFSNHSEAQTVVINDGVERANVLLESEHKAFVTDASVHLTIEVTPGVELGGGYTALFVDRLAIAPEQMDIVAVATNTLTVDHKGGTFYHGPTATLTLRY